MAVSPKPKPKNKRNQAPLEPRGTTVKEINKGRRAEAKASGYQQPLVTKGTDGVKSTSKSISPRKPSVAGVANKVKAQGKKMSTTPSARLNQGRKGR